MDLSDKRWAALEPVFRPHRRADGRGRLWTEPRTVLKRSALDILRTGAPVARSAERRYPPCQTCNRRFRLWQRSGLPELLLRRLVEDLPDRDKIDLSEGFVDAKFAGSRKGALLSVLRAAKREQDHGDLRPPLVFLSPSMWPTLHRRSRTLSTPPSRPASSRTTRRGCRRRSHRMAGVSVLRAAEDGTVLGLAPRLPAACDSLGTARRQLPRSTPSRLRPHPPAAYMR